MLDRPIPLAVCLVILIRYEGFTPRPASLFSSLLPFPALLVIARASCHCLEKEKREEKEKNLFLVFRSEERRDVRENNLL